MKEQKLDKKQEVVNDFLEIDEDTVKDLQEF